MVMYICTTVSKCGTCEIFVCVEDRACEEFRFGHETSEV